MCEVTAAPTETGVPPSSDTRYPVIAEPPSAGTLQAIVTEEPLTLAAGAAGAVGATGSTGGATTDTEFDAADAGEFPTALVAITVPEWLPTATPLNVCEVTAADSDTGAPPSSDTWYPVIAEPPSPGSVHTSVTDAPLTLAVGAAGASGATGITGGNVKLSVGDVAVL